MNGTALPTSKGGAGTTRQSSSLRATVFLSVQCILMLLHSFCADGLFIYFFWIIPSSFVRLPPPNGRGTVASVKDTTMPLSLATWHLAILLPASSRIPMTMHYKPFQAGRHTLVAATAITSEPRCPLCRPLQCRPSYRLGQCSGARSQRGVIARHRRATTRLELRSCNPSRKMFRRSLDQ